MRERGHEHGDSDGGQDEGLQAGDERVGAARRGAASGPTQRLGERADDRRGGELGVARRELAGATPSRSARANRSA